MIVSQPGGARNQSWVLSKSDKCSLLLGHLDNPGFMASSSHEFQPFLSFRLFFHQFLLPLSPQTTRQPLQEKQTSSFSSGSFYPGAKPQMGSPRGGRFQVCWLCHFCPALRSMGYCRPQVMPPDSLQEPWPSSSSTASVVLC